MSSALRSILREAADRGDRRAAPRGAEGLSATRPPAFAPRAEAGHPRGWCWAVPKPVARHGVSSASLYGPHPFRTTPMTPPLLWVSLRNANQEQIEIAPSSTR